MVIMRQSSHIRRYCWLGVAAIVFLVGNPAVAVACECGFEISAAAQSTVSAIGASSTAIVGALTTDTQLIIQAISGNQQIASTAQEKLLTAQQQQNAQAARDSRDLHSTRRYVETPSSCYTATAAAAMPAASAAVKQARHAIVVNQTDRSTGQNGAVTAKGPDAARDALVDDHQRRIGGAAPGDVPDSRDPAVKPGLFFAARTLTQAEVTGQGGNDNSPVSADWPSDPAHPNGPSGWVLDMENQGFDPHPRPIDVKTADNQKREEQITRITRMNFARLPFDDSQARRVEGATALHDWAVGLFQQAGLDSSNIPANPSWEEVMDALVNVRFGGAAWATSLSGMSPEQIAQENLQMQSVMLQLQWARFAYDEKVGAMLGNQYAYQLDQNR